MDALDLAELLGRQWLETSSNGACFGGMLMKQTGKHCGGFKGVLRF